MLFAITVPNPLSGLKILHEQPLERTPSTVVTNHRLSTLNCPVKQPESFTEFLKWVHRKYAEHNT